MKIGGCLSQSLVIAISLFNSPLPPTAATSIEEFECNRLIILLPQFCLFPFPLSFSLPSLLFFVLVIVILLLFFLLTNTTKLKHIRFPFLFDEPKK